MRDPRTDLEMCLDVTLTDSEQSDWEEAIRRAMAAEQRVEELEQRAQLERSLQITEAATAARARTLLARLSQCEPQEIEKLRSDAYDFLHKREWAGKPLEVIRRLQAVAEKAAQFCKDPQHSGLCLREIEEAAEDALWRSRELFGQAGDGWKEG